MTLPGETVSTGAPTTYQGQPIDGPKVMSSAAGYYIGYSCSEFMGHDENGEPMWMHGFPYSRESGYYNTQAEAEADLKSYTPRNTDYNG